MNISLYTNKVDEKGKAYKDFGLFAAVAKCQVGDRVKIDKSLESNFPYGIQYYIITKRYYYNEDTLIFELKTEKDVVPEIAVEFKMSIAYEN